KFQDSLFTSYIEGLRDMGWQGDARLVQYGFFLSTALRSVWEVPEFLQIHSKLAEEPNNETLRERLNQLERIIEVHKKCLRDAAALQRRFDLIEAGINKG